MVEKSKKQKASISEDDAYTLIQRYEPTTVLTLLQEVANFPDVKIDWKELVKKTSTGITNAREYQMLWRHLAYRDALLEKLGDEAEPLVCMTDDDSDLEYELEAFPNVTSEAAMEAAACVKVMIASGLQCESNLPNSSTVEAPLTINIPNGWSSRTSLDNSQPSSSMQGTNITIPVSVPKQPLPTVPSMEGVEANGLAGGNIPLKRKRKPWLEEEDMQLIAAVQKYGEGNWSNIVKGDFNWDRTAAQLSQRWAILRKKNTNMNVVTNSTGSQPTEAQLAARHAMSLALDMPVKNLTATGTTGPARTSMNTSSSNSVQPNTTAEASKINSLSVQAQHQSQQGPIPMKPSTLGSLGSSAKSHIISKKTLPKSNFSSDSALRAAAVAAGARIASPSDAASLRKAAQAKNAVHIIPTGGSSVKPSAPAVLPPRLEAHSNVHYISSGLTTAAPSSSSAVAVTPGASCTSTVKAVSSAVQNAQSTAKLPNITSEQNCSVSSVADELPSRQEVKTTEEMKGSFASCTPKEEVPDGASVVQNSPSNHSQEDKAVCKSQAAVTENSNCTLKIETRGNGHKTVDDNLGTKAGNGNKADLPVTGGGESHSAVNGSHENQSRNEKQANLPSVVQDGCSEKLELPNNKVEVGNEV
ncbi:putative DNA binding protein [Quillaja saponaria]|uniref:DNA binding protein n=1 Tax=Quillaja saponaria TaxID=32244 RepID=A0AAD7LYQ0_QUISA|nr:putative DNA binding protein [Quillaja saponaria]